jgi:hypothetical protein
LDLTWNRKKAAAAPIRIATTSQGNMNANAAIAQIAMARVDGNHSPNTPAVINAAIIPCVNQPPFALRRAGFVGEASCAAMWAITTFSNVVPGTCS